MSDETSEEMQLDVDLDARWLPVPLYTEHSPEEWGTEAVGLALSVREGLELSSPVRQVCEATYAGLLEVLRRRASQDADDVHLAAAYVFTPGEDVLPWTTVEFSATRLPEGLGVDRFVEDLVAPEDLRFGPPSVTDLQTRAGEAARVKQLLVVDAPDGGQEVHTSVVYVWQVEGSETTAVVMSSYFASAVDGELCEEALDELAASVRMEGVA